MNPLRVLNGVCALNGKDALAASSDELGPLYSLAADGKTTRPIELTIPGTKGRDPLVLQSSLASNRDGTACVVAMAFGNGLSLWNGAAFTRVARYREDIAFPVPIMNTRMQMTPTGERKVTFPTMPHRAIESALGVAMVPGRVRVLFEGGTANKGRIIDDYDDRTLEYLGSILLPTPVTEFTAPTSDMIVMVAKRNGFPMLVALRQRPEPAQ
ncbi:MAG: hypothetical protein ABJE10_11070 [bacterium]